MGFVFCILYHSGVYKVNNIDREDDPCPIWAGFSIHCGIPEGMDQTTLRFPMSSVRESKVENHLFPVQNVRPVFMTAAQIRNCRSLTAAAASFDAIPEHFRT